MKEYTLAQLAQVTGGQIIGNPQTIITTVKPIENAEPGAITFLGHIKYTHYLKTTQAAAVIVTPQVTEASVPLLQVKNPYYAFAQILAHMYPQKRPAPGIHPSAVIAENVQLGADVYIGQHVVIENGTKIGERTCIYAGTYIGENCQIGADCLLYPNISIYANISIGNKVIIHAGTVIGSDGFGYVFAEGKHQKIPQVGTVIIEDDVEIGANSAVDRAALGATRIGRNTKIDNQVQVAHNVELGESCILAGQVGIAGSTKLGKRVIVGGQAGIVDHLNLADDTRIAARTGVSKDTSAGETIGGFFGIPHQRWRKAEVIWRRLPDLYKQVQELEKKLAQLEKAKS